MRSGGHPIGPAADLLGAAALWGGMYVVSAATFTRIPPITLGLLRLVVGVAVLALALRLRLGFDRATLPRAVAAGVVVALTLVLQFVGTSLTSGAEGALLTTTTPAFVLVLGRALEGQSVRGIAWAGVAIALAGVAIVASRNAAPGPTGSLPLVGDALLVGSAATWALFSSVGRPLVAVHGAFRAILQAACVAIPVLVPFVALELATGASVRVDPPAALAVLYLGIGATALAWSLWYRGYAAAPSTVSAAAFFAQPLVGGVLGGLVLQEPLDGRFAVGALLIAAGILVLVAPPLRVRAERVV